jgi:putative ABC transport system permease protein
MALGLAATLLILAFISHETSYDDHHEYADRVYRVAVERAQPNEVIRSAVTPRPLAQTLEEHVPEIERAVRLSRERAEQVLIRHGTKGFFEDQFFFADSSIFDVFTIPLVRGRAAAALAEPFSVVLSEATARKIFGDADPLGETIMVRLRGDGDMFAYRVTGIARDLPETTHFHFSFLASYADHPNVGEADDQDNWAGLDLYTYLLLQPGVDAAQVDAKITAISRPSIEAQVEENFGVTLHEFREAGNRFDFFLQPIRDIHLHSNLRGEIEANGDARYVYLFAVIAAFVLGLACINFTHLATARAASRLKEIGVRKVLGARRGELIRQFLVEATVLTVAATGMAVAIVWICAPLLERLAERSIDFAGFANHQVALVLIAVPVVVGLGAGVVPAFYLSRLDPSEAIRGRGSRRTGRMALLRSGFVIFQFAVSGALIICTLVMERQMDFLQHAKLGFDKESIIVIDGTEVLADRMEIFQERIATVDGVVSVSNAQTIPGRELDEASVRVVDAPAAGVATVASLTAGFRYAEAMGLEIVAGRDFSREHPTDSMAVLLNETAVRVLGLDGESVPGGRTSESEVGSSASGSLDAAVGHTITAEGRDYEIIGVLADYHFASLHKAIDPLVIFGPDPWNRARPNIVVPVRIRPDDLTGTLFGLEQTWRTFVPNQPFVSSFLDEEFGRLYRSEANLRLLFRIFAGLAIFIACLGLFGLATYSAQRRTKEIGIRKVLGASAGRIMATMSLGFVGLVAAGIAVAVPVALVAMHRWLDEFAYRITMSPGVFVVGGLALMAISLAAIAYHVAGAALADPVNSLRAE